MTKIIDLSGVEVEHLVGLKAAPIVKLRAIGPGVVMVGQLSPAEARSTAAHLHEAAARAEYEVDLLTELTRVKMPEQAIALIFAAVRSGEQVRHMRPEGDQ